MEQGWRIIAELVVVPGLIDDMLLALLGQALPQGIRVELLPSRLARREHLLRAVELQLARLFRTDLLLLGIPCPVLGLALLGSGKIELPARGALLKEQGNMVGGNLSRAIVFPVDE